MSTDNLIHQTWLTEQIKAIRAYSGIHKPITMDSTIILDLHIDSLEMLELIAAIEDYTGQRLNDNIWVKWHRLQDIVDYLSQTKT